VSVFKQLAVAEDSEHSVLFLALKMVMMGIFHKEWEAVTSPGLNLISTSPSRIPNLKYKPMVMLQVMLQMTLTRHRWLAYFRRFFCSPKGRPK